ncbi:MAG: hypothetical protein ABSG63_20290, partial [Spirochaetia bacterium]
QLCGLAERLIVERRRPEPPLLDPARRRSLIRVTVVGLLFSAALAEPSRVDEEIEGLRRTILLMLAGE